MRLKYVLSLILLLMSSQLMAKAEVINVEPENWKSSEIPKALAADKITSMISMKDHHQKVGKKSDFMGNVFLVTLDNGLKGVFKQMKKGEMGDAYAEVGAYHASQYLGFPYIPPVIMTTVKGKRGSLQLFVESPIDPLTPGEYQKALAAADKEDLANFHLFNFVFGQWDTGAHNMLILKKSHKTYVIGIDNAGVGNRQYAKYGELPFVRLVYSDALKVEDFGNPFPFHKAKIMKDPSGEKFRKIFGKKLPKSFYKNFNSFSKTYRYVISQNSLWRQFHYGDDEFVKSYTEFLPKATKAKLESLSMKKLKEIFKPVKKAEFYKRPHFKTMLDRRDQVLAFFKKRKN